MTLAVLLLSFAVGCRSSEPASGTSVGNPGKLSPTIGEGEGVFVYAAWGTVDTIVMKTCDGTPTEIAVEAEIGFDGSEEIEIPPGNYCSAQLILEEPLEVDAEWKPDTEALFFHMHLPIADMVEVHSDSRFTVDDDALLLEVGGPGWLDSDDVEVAFDGQEFEDEDETTWALADAAAQTSALWRDDGDGFIDEDERDAGPIATPQGVADEEDEDPESTQSDTGCTTAASSPRLIFGLLVALVLGQRRRRTE